MKQKMIILILVLVSIFGNAQEPTLNPTIQPYLNVQFWNVSSYAFESAGELLDNRNSTYFRRGRLGLKGQLLEGLKYNLMLSFDYLGKAEDLSSKGNPNSGNIALWSAYFTWQPIINNQWFMITGGTFLPQISRESVTSPWTVSSLDKAETSCYLRQFVTGKSNGICPGINLGGLGTVGSGQLLYNVSIISRQDKTSITKTEWSPLYIGQAIICFGDKELTTYKYTLSGNPMKKKKLLSIGVGGSSQGSTDAFQSSSTYGADFMLQLNGFKLDGEYYFLNRENKSSYLATCCMMRIAYNLFLKKGWVLEPAAMVCQFKGDDSFQDASFFDGEDQLVDVGMNLIAPNHKQKINIHYIHRSGNSSISRRITADGTLGDYFNIGLQLRI